MKSEVIFSHLREYDSVDKVDGTTHPISNKGGITLAMRSDEDAPGVIEVGVSICNQLDNFDKKKGRLKSAARLSHRHPDNLKKIVLNFDEPINLFTRDGRSMVIEEVNNILNVVQDG